MSEERIEDKTGTPAMDTVGTKQDDISIPIAGPVDTQTGIPTEDTARETHCKVLSTLIRPRKNVVRVRFHPPHQES